MCYTNTKTVPYATNYRKINLFIPMRCRQDNLAIHFVCMKCICIEEGTHYGKLFYLKMFHNFLYKDNYKRVVVLGVFS